MSFLFPFFFVFHFLPYFLSLFPFPFLLFLFLSQLCARKRCFEGVGIISPFRPVKALILSSLHSHDLRVLDLCPQGKNLFSQVLREEVMILTIRLFQNFSDSCVQDVLILWADVWIFYDHCTIVRPI